MARRRARIPAELSLGFDRIEELDAALDPAIFTCLAVGSGFSGRQGHPAIPPGRWTPALHLPDFYLGAHATLEALTLLTRDARRFQICLPRLPLFAPRR